MLFSLVMSTRQVKIKQELRGVRFRSGLRKTEILEFHELPILALEVKYEVIFSKKIDIFKFDRN